MLPCAKAERKAGVDEERESMLQVHCLLFLVHSGGADFCEQEE